MAALFSHPLRPAATAASVSVFDSRDRCSSRSIIIVAVARDFRLLQADQPCPTPSCAGRGTSSGRVLRRDCDEKGRSTLKVPLPTTESKHRRPMFATAEHPSGQSRHRSATQDKDRASTGPAVHPGLRDLAKARWAPPHPPHPSNPRLEDQGAYPHDRQQGRRLLAERVLAGDRPVRVLGADVERVDPFKGTHPRPKGEEVGDLHDWNLGPALRSDRDDRI